MTDGTSSDGVENVAKRASTEWDYVEAESAFDLPPQSVSIPCQLKFTGKPERDVDRFHEVLTTQGFTPIVSNPTRGYQSPHYSGSVCSMEHHNRIRVLVFRSNVVRLYPKDDHVPDSEELASLLHALMVGFQSELEHNPIQQKDTEKERDRDA